MIYIPNLWTWLRIGLAPVLVLLLQNQSYKAALGVFLIAGITDGLDGFIAKRFDYVTRLGSILDPLADKLLLLSVFVMLTIAGDFPFWLLIVAGFRDLVIVSGVVVLMIVYDESDMKPIWSSKLNTFLQISLVISQQVPQAGISQLQWPNQVLIWFVAITTVLSGVQYVYEWGIRKEHDNRAKRP